MALWSGAYYYPQTSEARVIPQFAMSKTRDFCYTINNYTDQHIKLLQEIDCKYVVYGKEISETGTPHLQGYIRFANQRTIKSVINKIPGAHIEIKKGTFTEAIDYCKKDGVVYERGEAPLTKEQKGDCNKRRHEEAFNAAKEGRFDDIPADLRLRFYGTLKKIREDHLPRPEPLTELQNEWRYGPTGTGKSRTAQEVYPDAYLKKANTKWWDGYIDQEVVIIDDFDKYHIQLGYELKIWLDHYPFHAERKGGSSMIRPKKIIITSNYHPEDIWDDEKTLNPILRRVQLVKYGEQDQAKAWHHSYNNPL